jgi:chromosome segregation ATPase
MSRDTLEVLEERLQHFVARHEAVRGEREALAARLAAMERAYAEVCQRLSRYERERGEIRSRLQRILLCIDAAEQV